MNDKLQSPFDNPDTREYWTAARGGSVMVQRCADCGASYAYPRPYCVRCFGDDVSLIKSSGRGQIYAKTVVHLPSQEGAETDYTVALVQLDEGIRLLARVDGPEVETGQAVALRWDLSRGRPLLIATVRDADPGP